MTASSAAPTPTVGNSLAMAAFGAVGFGVLASVGQFVPGPAALNSQAISTWATTTDPADIAISVTRLLGLASSIYLVAIGIVGAIAAGTKWRGVHRLWRAITTTSTRQLIAGGLAVAVSVPVVGSAHAPAEAVLSDVGPSSTVSLTDLGASASITDLGPAAEAVSSPSLAPISEPTSTNQTDGAADDVWVVARGDHLWSIAAETLADEWERPPGEREIEAYWRRLIDANRSLVGANPDLLFPGQTLTLPPVA